MDDQISTFAWEKYPQPFWNESSSVARALRLVSDAQDEQQAGDAYAETLQAFGNRRTGTYWPVVLPATQFLAEILDGSDEWARAAALDVLIELTTCYVPEPGFETFRSISGPEVDVAKDLSRRIKQLLPTVRKIASSSSSAQRERDRAEELIFCVSGGSSPLG